MVSVLFCDIQAFSVRSAASTPQEIVALLNEYLPLLVHARRHGQQIWRRQREFELIALGAVEIRGKTRPVRVWAIKKAN